MNRHQFLFGFPALFSLPTSSLWAQIFSSKPIKIIVPFAAGGVADLAAWLIESAGNLGWQVIPFRCTPDVVTPLRWSDVIERTKIERQ